MPRITDAKVIVTCSGRNFVTLKTETDEYLAAKYEYKRAFLPVSRLEDGTMFNW